MRIAIVHPYASKAGMEETASTIISRDRALGSLLERLGHSVKGFKATEGVGRKVESHDDFLDWIYCPLDTNSPTKPGSGVFSTRLLDAVGDWYPDLVFIKGIGSSMGRELVRRYPNCIVAIIGGNYTEPAISRATIILTEKPEQERFLRPRVGSDRLIRLPKLVSSLFTDGQDEEALYDVVVVGKFEAHKNHKALKPLFHHDLSLVLIGEGSLKDKLAAEALDGVARVEFCGFVGPAEVATYLRRSRLLVHPSLSEGVPRAVVEAMASGTPSVCIRGVVGWPLVDGVNSLLVSPDDLVPRTLDLLNDDAALERMSQGALDTFEREFSLAALEDAAVAIDFRVRALTKRSRRGTLLTFGRVARFHMVNAPRVGYRGVRRLAAMWLRPVRR